LIATVQGNVTAYLDKDAISGRNIDYTVRAFGKANEGSSTFTANRIAYVGIPHLTSVANSVGGLTVKWDAVANAQGYRVYRRAAGEKYFTYLGTVKTTSYVDKTVKNGVYYKYTVRTVFYSIFSNYEDGLLCRYVATPKLTSISNTANGIKISWGAVSGSTGYRVYRRGAGQTTWTYLGTVTGTSYTDTSVKNAKGQYFRYTVRAVNGYYSGFDTNGLYIKRS
jgi:fibronectin type 3 domain-containing protein